jgi:hypothetical protein
LCKDFKQLFIDIAQRKADEKKRKLEEATRIAEERLNAKRKKLDEGDAAAQKLDGDKESPLPQAKGAPSATPEKSNKSGEAKATDSDVVPGTPTVKATPKKNKVGALFFICPNSPLTLLLP